MDMRRTDTKAAREAVPTGRSAGPETFDPYPTVIDPTALADRPPDFPPDAAPYDLVRADKADQPIEFTAPMTAAVHIFWLYRVYINGQSDSVEYPVTEADIADRTFHIVVTPDRYPDSETYNLQYDCKSQLEDEWSRLSPPHFFTIDRESPGPSRPSRPILDPDLLEEGLNHDKMDELGGVVRALIPNYGGRIHGDSIVGLLNRPGDPSRTVKTEPKRIPYGETNEPFEIEFPRAMFEAIGDGMIMVQFQVTDMAGNVSLESAAAPLEVFLTDVIDDLKVPRIPALESSQIIDELLARRNVELLISGHDRLEVHDLVVVQWGSLRYSRRLSGDDPSGEVAMRLTIPYGDVLASWVEADKDAVGSAVVAVNYEIYRASQLVGRPASDTLARINLSQAGGADPFPQTPENEALGKPVVRHSRWQSGERENYIPDTSIQENHTYVVPWFVRNADGDVTGESAFVQGDGIICLYGGSSFGSVHEVTSAEVIAKVDLELPLPWEKVAAEGSGMQDIAYATSRRIPAEAIFNSNWSPLGRVEAEASGDLPGGGKPLPTAHFDTEHVIGSRVARTGHASVIVPPYGDMQVGDVVRVHVTAHHWVPQESTLGEPVLNAEWGGPSGVNPTSGHAYERRLTEADIGRDIAFEWPERHIQWVWPYGRARIQYCVTRADGTHIVTSPLGEDCIIDMSGNAGPPAQDTQTQRDPPSFQTVIAEAKVSRNRGAAAANEFARRFCTSRAQLRFRRASTKTRQ
ncbi:hypothetical protein PAN31117_04451 [Pandoraea anapnoica]|uniref:Uncharacterized protein n=1 Tax=Pandoraea anapnoica TaxID=2508301 RepID=A0A5E5AHP6_9BURK|nr:hypothetical protein [Pandoraea anapnoica]VVE72597.1 hypothetical protein PAN31117_04451 [Pandoraea anapnoica]